jgi:hypothetical protein
LTGAVGPYNSLNLIKAYFQAFAFIDYCGFPLILQAIVAFCSPHAARSIFAIIGPDLLRKYNMVSDAVSDENHRKGLKIMGNGAPAWN